LLKDIWAWPEDLHRREWMIFLIADLAAKEVAKGLAEMYRLDDM